MENEWKQLVENTSGQKRGEKTSGNTSGKN